MKKTLIIMLTIALIIMAAGCSDGNENRSPPPRMKHSRLVLLQMKRRVERSK